MPTEPVPVRIAAGSSDATAVPTADDLHGAQVAIVGVPAARLVGVDPAVSGGDETVVRFVRRKRKDGDS